MISPHKPKLQDKDLKLLKNYVTARISTTRSEQVDDDTEAI